MQRGDEDGDSESRPISQDAAGETTAARTRLSSVASTSWENVRYKRRSDSVTSLSSASAATMQPGPPPAGGSAATRPPSTRTYTAPPRPILKNRAPSSQVMAYHFKNGSTGHLNSPPSHYYQRYQPPSHSYRQPHYRKSASQTSINRWESSSRRSSVISLDDVPGGDGRPSRQFQLPTSSAYGHSSSPYGDMGRMNSVSQSAYSLDIPANDALERRYSKQYRSSSAYGHSGPYGDMGMRNHVSQSAYSLDIPQASNDHPDRRYSRQQSNDHDHGNNGFAYNYFSGGTNGGGRGGGDLSRRTSLLSQSSRTSLSRPLPPEPPVLPPPDLNPGWPPRGWHVYVSAMTHDYLYGADYVETRPPLDDYVFDQDTLTFVRQSRSSQAPPVGAAGAVQVSNGVGVGMPRGRGTQSLDLPREHQVGRDLDFESIYAKGVDRVTGATVGQGQPQPQQQEGKRRPSTLKKNILKSNTSKSGKKAEKSNGGTSLPASPSHEPVPAAQAVSPPVIARPTPKAASSPTSSTNLLSFLRSPSASSLSSKKSTKSKNGNGGWPWRKRTQSFSSTGDRHDAPGEVPPPVPALPPDVLASAQGVVKQKSVGGENKLRKEPTKKDVAPAVKENAKAKLEVVPDPDSRRGSTLSGVSTLPAFRDSSVQYDWSLQAQPLSGYSDGEGHTDGTVNGSASESGVVENASASASASANGVDSSDGDENNETTPTESNPSSSTTSSNKAEDVKDKKKAKAKTKVKTKGLFGGTGYPSPPASSTGHQQPQQSPQQPRYHYRRRNTSSVSIEETNPGTPTRSNTIVPNQTTKPTAQNPPPALNHVVDHELSPSPYPRPARRPFSDSGHSNNNVYPNHHNASSATFTPSSATPSMASSPTPSSASQHYYGSGYKQRPKHGRSSSVLITPAPATPVLAQLQWDARSRSSVALSSSQSDWSSSGRPESSVSGWGNGTGTGTVWGSGYGYASTSASPSASRPPSSMSNTTVTSSAAAMSPIPAHPRGRGVSSPLPMAMYASYTDSPSDTGLARGLVVEGGRMIGSTGGDTSSAAASASGSTTTPAPPAPLTMPPSPPFSSPPPAKIKGWRRWTSPLSSRRASIDDEGHVKVEREKDVVKAKVEAKERPSMTVDRVDEIGVLGRGGIDGSYGSTESPALIWSAPEPGQGSKAKLRKKRK